MEIKKRNMIPQDLKTAHTYATGIASLILSLFVPFALLVIIIFKTSGLLIVAFLIPLIALVVGIIGFIKSSRQTSSSLKMTRIFNLIAIILSFACLAFLLYIFIKGGVFSAI
jgi:uncharacterized membrane protein (GlpM family)